MYNDIQVNDLKNSFNGNEAVKGSSIVRSKEESRLLSHLFN